MTTNTYPATLDQLEITFAAPPAPPRPKQPAPPRSRRQIAARWWFARMRDVVREARTWSAETQALVNASVTQNDLPLSFSPTRLNRSALTLAVVTQTTAFPGQIEPFPSTPAAAA